MAERTFAYGEFVGLDTITQPEVMTEKFLAVLNHAYVDFRGQINKAKAPTSYAGYQARGLDVQHYGSDDATVLVSDGANIDVYSTTGQNLENAFSGAYQNAAFTTFGGRQVIMVKGQPAVTYNGKAFTFNTNIPQGGACATVLNRMAVADIPDKPTLIKLPVADNIDDWTTGSTATSGSEIDIKNQLTASDAIKGLGTLEGDKLAVFCQNETLLYSANTDMTLWTIIRDFRVPLGVFGKRTIKPVGVDLFFCSKVGVHSLRRAASGLTLETVTMSRAVQSLFDYLVTNVPEGREPKAVWNANLGQYQVFFPRAGDKWDKLVFTYEQGLGRGQHQSWSFTEDVPTTGASYFAGVAIGSDWNSGLAKLEDTTDAVDMLVRTAVLWQGAPNRVKQYRRLLVRATGDAKFTVKVYDQDGRLLQQSDHQPNPPSPFTTGIPRVSPERPVNVPCRHRAKGLSIEFICSNPGDLKILDFAIVVEM